MYVNVNEIQRRFRWTIYTLKCREHIVVLRDSFFPKRFECFVNLDARYFCVVVCRASRGELGYGFSLHEMACSRDM